MPAEDLTTGKGAQSKDFRVVYSNTMGLQFSGAELILKFSILNDFSNPAAGHVEQVAVAMNPVNMKALWQALDAVIKHHEKVTGAPIPVNPETQQGIDKAIAATSKKPA
jgi:hypothetical protein